MRIEGTSRGGLHLELYIPAPMRATGSLLTEVDEFLKQDMSASEVTRKIAGAQGTHAMPSSLSSLAQSDMAFLAGEALLPSPTAQALKTLRIIYTNDIHGAISPSKDDKDEHKTVAGLSSMGSVIRKLEKENHDNVILLDGGDWGQGSYESKLTKGQTLIECMNNLNYDAAEVGNHEFDWGREALSKMIERADFPVLGANILENGEIMKGLKPYAIKEVGGLKVGIIGIISPETPGTVDPRTIKGLTFAGARETVEKYMPELKEKGVDMVLVLSHEGVAADEKLAGSTPLINVIVGGHSHTLMPEPSIVNNTIIVQAGTGGEEVGELTLDIDAKDHKIVSYKNTLIPVTSDAGSDPEIEKIIAPVVAEAQEKMSQVVGKTEVDLTHDRKKVYETVMGNVLTDAMRETTGSDLALQNSGGIRDQIMKGDVTFGDLYRVLPFDKFTVTMDLTGAQVKELLENSAGRKKGNLQVSGLTMDVNPRNPKGKKVSNVMIKGLPLDEKKTYKVATDDFLAAGANGFGTFTEGKNVQYCGVTIDGLKAYFEGHSPFTAETARIEGRINFLSPPEGNR
jgi:5'-nucleotidase / UDP-sugar diphosphatase